MVKSIGKRFLSHVGQKYRPRYYALRYQPRRFGSIHYPNNEKLITKGIESVRKRVTNLKEYLDIDIEEFKRFIRSSLCDHEECLTQKISTTLKNRNGIPPGRMDIGKQSRYTWIRKGYVPAGEIEIRLEIKNGIIKSMNLVGDYFLVGEIDEFLNKFQNVPFTPQSVNRILDDNPIENYIRQLSRKSFIDILFNNN